MNIIGFNFTKIGAERSPDFKMPFQLDTNIEFLTLNKERLDILREGEAISARFKFSLNYHELDEKAAGKKGAKQGEVAFEGTLTLSTTKDEARELLRSWKKKEIPPHLRQPLFNTILRKCTLRSLALQDELNLPPHIQIPLLDFKK